MTSRKRRHLRAVNGHASPPEPQAVEPEQRGVTLAIDPTPIRMAPKGVLRLDAPVDPTNTMVLVLDALANTWRAVLLPPGSRWVLKADVEEKAKAKAALWLPPGTPR